MNQYRTSSGTFSSEQLAIVVWRNPKQRKSRNARFLETMTTETSPHPMAFPIASLKSRKEWAAATYVTSRDEFLDALSGSSRAKPMIVPLPVAEAALGWDVFYVATEYTE